MNKYAEYLCYIFGDNPDAIRVITSFTSQKIYQKNTRPYDAPLVLETSGLLGFNRTSHRIVNPLERSLYEMLRNMGKVSLYDYLVDALRQHHEKIVFSLGVLERVAQINVSDESLAKFLATVHTDVDQTVKKFIYLYLMSIDEAAVRDWFANSRRVWDECENEIVQLVRNVREAGAACCGSIAAATRLSDQQRSSDTAGSTTSLRRPPLDAAGGNATKTSPEKRRRK